MGISESQIIAYLLGHLAEPERSCLEARLLEDERFFRLVSEIEDDLIIRYVRGDLESQLVPTFEKAYFNSPTRSARVESARALRAALQDVASQRAEPRASRSGLSRLRFAFALVSVVVVLILVILPLWKNRKSAHDPSPMATIQPSGNGALLSFLLEPGLFRSGDGKQLVLPAGTKQVEFELVLRDATEATAYLATLSTPEHPGAWSGIAAQRGTHFYIVVAESILKPGDYTLEMVSTDPKGKRQGPTVYYFRIVR